MAEMLGELGGVILSLFRSFSPKTGPRVVWCGGEPDGAGRVNCWPSSVSTEPHEVSAKPMRTSYKVNR